MKNESIYKRIVKNLEKEESYRDFSFFTLIYMI